MVAVDNKEDTKFRYNKDMIIFLDYFQKYKLRVNFIIITIITE